MNILIEMILSLFRRSGPEFVAEKPAAIPESKPAPKPVEEIKVVISEEKPMATEKQPVLVTGWVSELYESGGRGVGTISTGRGDHGGASYGKHQLSSKSGTMAAFLKSSHGAPFTEFAGLVPATEKFNEVYKQVAANRGSEFSTAQSQYIRETHYDIQAAKLNKAGFKLEERHQAVREMVYSTAVQYGPNTSVILKSQIGLLMTDEQIIRKVQTYKHDTVGVYFKSSSPAVQKSVANRCKEEMATLLKSLKG